jgi:hypothetical protein
MPPHRRRCDLGHPRAAYDLRLDILITEARGLQGRTGKSWIVQCPESSNPNANRSEMEGTFGILQPVPQSADEVFGRIPRRSCSEAPGWCAESWPASPPVTFASCARNCRSKSFFRRASSLGFVSLCLVRYSWRTHGEAPLVPAAETACMIGAQLKKNRAAEWPPRCNRL